MCHIPSRDLFQLPSPYYFHQQVNGQSHMRWFKASSAHLKQKCLGWGLVWPAQMVGLMSVLEYLGSEVMDVGISNFVISSHLQCWWIL
jgi:hypothetical protein